MIFKKKVAIFPEKQETLIAAQSCFSGKIPVYLENIYFHIRFSFFYQLSFSLNV